VPSFALYIYLALSTHTPGWPPATSPAACQLIDQPNKYRSWVAGWLRSAWDRSASQYARRTL